MKTLFTERALQSAALIEQLARGALPERIERAVDLLTQTLRARLPVLICGNGGSSSDALHIAGELVGRFLVERPAYNVIALSANSSVITAWSNDYDYETVFSRQVEAHGQPGGVVWGISTSGNSANVMRALEVGAKMGMKTLGLTGDGGGKIAGVCDLLLDVPSRETPRIQEMHIVLYHFICEQVEAVLGR
jgi:D-sedoheptulose 7-phosphate isomerase